MNSKHTIDEYLRLKILAYIHIYFLFRNKSANFLDLNVRTPIKSRLNSLLYMHN